LDTAVEVGAGQMCYILPPRTGTHISPSDSIQTIFMVCRIPNWGNVQSYMLTSQPNSYCGPLMRSHEDEHHGGERILFSYNTRILCSSNDICFFYYDNANKSNIGLTMVMPD